MSHVVNGSPGQRFAHLIKAARIRAGLSQQELADEAGVGVYTLSRWESGRTPRPVPETVRKVVAVLGIDPREVPIALGYVTTEEMGLPPAPQRTLAPEYADILDLLTNPKTPDREKREAAEYLRWRYRRNFPTEKEISRGTPEESQTSNPSR